MHGVYGQDNSYEHCSAQAKCMVHDAWIGVRIILVCAVLLYVECWRCWKQSLNSCRNASHTNRNGTSTTIRVRQTSPSFWFSLQFFWLDVLFSLVCSYNPRVYRVCKSIILYIVCAPHLFILFDLTKRQTSWAMPLEQMIDWCRALPAFSVRNTRYLKFIN